MFQATTLTNFANFADRTRPESGAPIGTRTPSTRVPSCASRRRATSRSSTKRPSSGTQTTQKTSSSFVQSTMILPGLWSAGRSLTTSAAPGASPLAERSSSRRPSTCRRGWPSRASSRTRSRSTEEFQPGLSKVIKLASLEKAIKPNFPFNL